MKACDGMFKKEWKEKVIKKIIKEKGGGSGVDFTTWLCGKQDLKACDHFEENLDDEEDEEEEMNKEEF